MQAKNNEKKDLESLIKKLESASDKKIGRELINECYNILNYYKKPLTKEYSEISSFCSELRAYSEIKHHFPSECVKRIWKKAIIKYLNYARENIESFNKI